jgi:hypothetical protein
LQFAIRNLQSLAGSFPVSTAQASGLNESDERREETIIPANNKNGEGNDGPG